jgi:hypothetical protein
MALGIGSSKCLVTQVLPVHPSTPGLRREEVASLAGVSVDYYNGLERFELG